MKFYINLKMVTDLKTIHIIRRTFYAYHWKIICYNQLHLFMVRNCIFISCISYKKIQTRRNLPSYPSHCNKWLMRGWGRYLQVTLQTRAPENFCSSRWGAKQRVQRAQTWERGPPSALAEISTHKTPKPIQSQEVFLKPKSTAKFPLNCT